MRFAEQTCLGVRILCVMTSEKVRVVVGDDHPMFRDGVVRALVSSGSIEVVAEADDGAMALAAIRAHQPQVALLDYRMPNMDGAEVAAAVLRDQLPTRVLLVSAHDESAIVYQALQNGAAGFCPRSPRGRSWCRPSSTAPTGATWWRPAWPPGWQARSAGAPTTTARC